MRRIPNLASGIAKTDKEGRGLIKRQKILNEISRSGYDAAEEFPWWRSGVSEGVGALTAGIYTKEMLLPISSYLTGSNLGESAFKNDTDGPVKVSKIAFNTYTSAGGPNDVADLLSRVAVKMKTPDREIISKWIPITSLHSDPNYYLHGGMQQYCIELPTPYYLPAQNIFKIAATGIALTSTIPIQISLRGYHPLDRDPIIMNKSGTLPVPTAGVTSFIDFSFDEDRDQPLRDMLLEDVVVAVTGYDDDAITNNGFVHSRIGLQFEPPAGPKWSIDPASIIGALTSFLNVTTFTNGVSVNAYAPGVIYEPIEPFILQPGQAIDIEVMNTQTWDSDEVFVLYATVMGTQRGSRE